MGSSFIFKQFTLQQEQAAFKLGTDSVLLGSWIPDQNYKRILDLGAGTGILSLMMAQRFENSEILAIEIDRLSVADCAHNFIESKWYNRLKIIEDDVYNWGKTNLNITFDLIVTNPPYFSKSLRSPNPRKSMTRHSDHIYSLMLLEFVTKHLNINGYFGIILPTKEFEYLTTSLLNNDFYQNAVCRVSSFENGEIIREMGLFSYTQKTLVQENQFLYNAKNVRSDWYNSISNDFYIK